MAKRCSTTIRCATSPVGFLLHLSKHKATIPPPDRKILDMLPDRPPQVTFSCDNATSTCSFQFWTAQDESFYCALDTCTSRKKTGYDSDTISYSCQKIKCRCIPGRFLCGEDGSVGRACPVLFVSSVNSCTLQIFPTSSSRRFVVPQSLVAKLMLAAVSKSLP